MAEAPLVTIVETRSYLARAETLMNSDEREAVKTALAADPECGVVMRGTGGVRKLRVALQGRGKSGGARVVYYFRNQSMPLFLLAIFAKNEKDNLSAAERAQIAALVYTLVRTYGRSS